jgi:putative hydrolase of the HAD superfamily
VSFPRLVVFDLDDTLFPEREYVNSGFAAVDRAIRRRFDHHGFEEVARELFESGVRGCVFDEALLRLGLSPDRPTVEKLVEIYRNHVPAIRLFDDVPRALDQLDGRARRAIISDGPLPSQRRKVAALRLGLRFDPIVLTDIWGRAFWKPHERAFQTVEAATGCTGSDCVYVGDNPTKDFLAPRALGWRTIRLRRPGCEHAGVEAEGAADVECSVLDDLGSILATETRVEEVRR